MNSKRASEIADCPVMMNVTYNGNPVYIEAVKKDTAKIHFLNQPNRMQEVSLNSLIEH